MLSVVRALFRELSYRSELQMAAPVITELHSDCNDLFMVMRLSLITEYWCE